MFFSGGFSNRIISVDSATFRLHHLQPGRWSIETSRCLQKLSGWNHPPPPSTEKNISKYLYISPCTVYFLLSLQWRRLRLYSSTFRFQSLSCHQPRLEGWTGCGCDPVLPATNTRGNVQSQKYNFSLTLSLIYIPFFRNRLPDGSSFSIA